MNDENLDQMSGINEAESGGTYTPEYTGYENNGPRLTPEEPTSSSGGGAGKFVLVLFVLAVVALVATCVFGAVGGSKAERFIKRLTDDYLFGMSNEIAELATKDGNMVTEISVDASAIGTLLDVTIDDVKKVSLIAEQDKKGSDFSGKVSMNLDSTELVGASYAKTGEMVGVKIEDWFEEYIAVENKNLKDLARKLGAPEEDIARIPDKLTEENLTELLSEGESSNELTPQEAEKILKKYKKPLADALEGNIISAKNQELTIKDEKLKVTKDTLVISEKMLYEVLKAIIEVAKDDEDLFEVVKDNNPGEYDDYTFESWSAELEESLEQFDILIDGAGTEALYELNVYSKGSTTYAIELVSTEVQMSISVAGLNEKNSSYVEFLVKYVDGKDEEVRVIANTVKDGNTYKTDFDVNVATYSMNLNMTLFECVQKYSANANVEKLSSANTFVLNDEDEMSIQNKMTEISENTLTYLEGITQKFPEGLLEEIAAKQEEGEYDVSFGDEEDYEYDFEDYYDEEFKLQTAQVFVLADSTKKYEAIKLNSSRADVVALMGEPSYTDTYEDAETLSWEDEYYNDHSVVIINGVVTEKARYIESSSYDGIQLSTEIGTTTEDLELVIDNVKEDMTLEEVKAVLGENCIETARNVDGDVEYVWYDVKEQNVSVYFDKDNKVIYAGMVWGSY